MRRVFKIHIILFFLVITCACSQSEKNCKNGIFLERDGIIIMEAESIQLSDGWLLESSFENFSGEGYITWKNLTTVEIKDQGLLKYKFKIDNPGLYTLKIRNYHPCDDFTECNDVFVKMNDGDWRKNFNHNVNSWDWNSQQDIEHVFSNSEFDLEKGEHTLYLSGRSQDFSIDKLALFRNGVSEDAIKTAQESACIDK